MTKSETNWLKAEHIGDGNLGAILSPLVIEKAEVGHFDPEKTKLSLDLTFTNHDRQFGCNITNRRRLEMMFGEDLDITGLAGKIIAIQVELDKFQGKEILCCRIVAPAHTTAENATQQNRASAEAHAAADRGMAAHVGAQEVRTRAEPLGEPIPTPGHGTEEPPNFIDAQDPGADDVPF